MISSSSSLSSSAASAVSGLTLVASAPAPAAAASCFLDEVGLAASFERPLDGRVFLVGLRFDGRGRSATVPAVASGGSPNQKHHPHPASGLAHLRRDSHRDSLLHR